MTFLTRYGVSNLVQKLLQSHLPLCISFLPISLRKILSNLVHNGHILRISLPQPEPCYCLYFSLSNLHCYVKLWGLPLLYTNLTFRGPCIVIYSYNKTNEMHKFHKFIFGIEFYIFLTGLLSIIRSLVLYTQQ